MGKKTSKKTKKSNGTGKFFLGAILGTAAGVIASYFTEDKSKSCDCKKTTAKKAIAKKPVAKKSTSKKSTTKK